MPNIKASVQDVKRTAIRNSRNRSVKASLKTSFKKFEALVAENKMDEAAEFFKSVVKGLDKAVSKGIIHKNTASRKKSRLAVKLNKVSA
ncbi:MAG: 30S ribosomal protein S20 [bacterium]